MNIRLLALMPLSLLLTASIQAPTAVDDAPAIAELRAELVRLRQRIDQLDSQAGGNGTNYRVGSVANKRMEFSGQYGSIVIDRDGVAINADKVRINGKTIGLAATRTLNLDGEAVVLRGGTVDVKATSDPALKGSKIGGN